MIWRFGIAMLQCSVHPKYKGIKEPRKTKKYPDGCQACWWVYYFKQAEKNGFLGWQEVNYDVLDKEAVAIGIINKSL